MRRWTANLVSFSRLVLIVPWCIVQWEGGLSALPIMALIAATDLADGRIARRLSIAAETGAWIDASCDMAVGLAAMIVLAARNPLYLLVALGMCAAFSSWIVLRLRNGRLAYTRLGRYIGALCYALALIGSGSGLLSRSGATFPPRMETFLICAVVLYLAASTAENMGNGSRRPTGAGFRRLSLTSTADGEKRE